MKISEILKKYDTDKNKGHHYGAAYDDIFKRFNQLDALNILEIGTQKGGSLLAWQEYFPNAEVTGIDIIDAVTEKNRSDKINYVIQDVNEFHTNKTFDIVIDDGSHWLKDVVHSVVYFSHKLNPKGVMIIEDIQNPSLWVDVIRDILSSLWDYNKNKKFIIHYLDLRQINKQVDDFLILIERN